MLGLTSNPGSLQRKLKWSPIRSGGLEQPDMFSEFSVDE